MTRKKQRLKVTEDFQIVSVNYGYLKWDILPILRFKIQYTQKYVNFLSKIFQLLPYPYIWTLVLDQ